MTTTDSTTTGLSNEQKIAAFFLSKGLNPAAVSGILGNAEVESNFSPTSYNPNEGAIGIFQDEGGRRTALDSYAASRNLKETDVNAQLGYAWGELTSPGYANVLATLRGVPNTSAGASQAASAWDQFFERSSGAARTQRENDATSIYNRLGSSAGLGGQTSAVLASLTEPVGGGIIPYNPFTLPFQAGGALVQGAVSSWVAPIIVWGMKLSLVAVGGLMVIAGLYRASDSEHQGGVGEALKWIAQNPEVAA